MVDHMSKFTYAIPIKDKRSETVARMVGQVMLPMCVCKPVRMLSDNGPEFVGWEFEQMLREWGIEHVYSTPYMPNANGLAERTVRTLTEILRMMSTCGNDWDLYVGRALWAYNATVHKSTGMSPCKFVLNFEKIIRPRLGVSEDDRDVWRKANKRFESFKVGERVMKEVIEKGRMNVNKVRDKFEGPYDVLEVGSSGLSYVLGKLCVGGIVEKIRAHHNQLRKWNEVREYIQENGMSKWLKRNKGEPSMYEDLGLEGKQLVLVEYKKRKNTRALSKDERRGNFISKSENRNKYDKGVNVQVCMEDKCVNTDESWLSMNDTYCVCGFSLGDVKERMTNARVRDKRMISSMNESFTKVENVFDEIDELFTEMSVIIGPDENEVDMIVHDILDDRDLDRNSVNVANDCDKEEVNERVYGGPVTRSRGPVPDCDWVMKKIM
ncbi:uncharacterized protein [Palaemon carinicauda]|uniref:uncharacterized protein n=1 Tax=Palaemon carinicauda TaxID=392227 RepID=UPI0035B6168C